MDFHSLTRKELQSLCKLNKIPANITNVAMADALQSLEIVNGIEEFMNVSKSDTADLVESMENIEASSPKAPTTRCRTSTRQKVKIIEPENLPPTAAKSTRRGKKQSVEEIEESKKEILKTPAISTTRRKAPATLSRRNVNKQLNECENAAKEEVELKKPYSTRRSSRLTEKKSTEPRVKKESEKAVKMDAFVDEVNITSEEMNATSKNTIISGNPAAEVEEICNAFEKLDMVIVNEEANHKSGEEIQDFGELNQELTNEMVVEEGDVNSVLEEVVDEAKDCGEIENLKESTNETSNPGEQFFGNTTSNPCKDEMVVEEGVVNSVLENPCEDEMVVEEGDVNSVLEEVVDEEKEDCSEIDILEKESTNETSNPCENGDLEEKLKMGENDVEEYDAKPESDGISSPFEFQNAEQKLGLQEALSGNISIAVNDLAEEETSDSNDTLSPIEDENLEQKIDLEDNTFDASAGANSSAVLNQQKHSVLLDNNSSHESGAEDSVGSPELAHKEENFEHTFELEDKILDVSEGNKLSAVKEDNQILESNADGFTYLSIFKAFTEKTVNEKTDENSGEIANVPDEKDELCVFPAAPCLFKKATPLKNMSIVSDGKENIDSGRKLQIGFVEQGKKSKKEEKTDIPKLASYNETSIRQLKKQLKLLTLKNVDAKKEGVATRPALQALCENQLVGGELKN